MKKRREVQIIEKTKNRQNEKTLNAGIDSETVFLQEGIIRTSGNQYHQ